MDWVLFCQIEIIILTIGLVISFNMSYLRNAKDRSFFNRLSGTSKALSDTLKEMTKMATAEQFVSKAEHQRYCEKIDRLLKEKKNDE